MKLLKCDECMADFVRNDGYILTCPDDECKGERLFFCSKTCLEKHQFKVPITLEDIQSPEWILHYEQGKNHERALWKEKIQKRLDEQFIERAKITDISDVDWEYKPKEILLKETRISELEGLLKK